MAFVCPWWRSAGGKILSSYLDEKRTLDYLGKAYGKMAFASAGGYDTVWGKNTLDATATVNQEEIDIPDADTIEDEEIDDPEGQTNPDGTIKKIVRTKYATKKVKTEGVYSRVAGDKFRPKDHLVSISTSGMDNLGMTQKGSYTYRTYGGLGALPTVGASKSMAWGWAYGGKVIGSEGFTGKVIGYNISSNSEGGFDVTVEMIGNNTSVSVASISADAGSPEFAGSTQKDAAGNEAVIAGIFSAFADCDKQAADGKAAAASVTFNNGLSGCIIEIPEDYDKAKTEPSTNDTSKMQYKAYVTFASVVACVNKVLTTYTNTKLDSSDAAVTWWDNTIQAGNPLELLVPGNSTYGDKTFETSGTSDGDPNGLLISCDKLAKMGGITVEESSASDGVKRRLSIKTFFDNVFNLINDNTGQAFSLTLANSATKTDTTIYIVDFNKLPDPGVTSIGTVRSANLSAKLDSDQASMFYIIKNAPRDAKQNSGGSAAAAPAPTDYATLVKAVGKLPDEQNTAALKSANKQLIAAKLATAKGFGTAAPWDLSVVLDGTGGWQYGGVIAYANASAAALVPGYKVGFAITNVNHSVSDGDWTVSLSTYCRIYN